ncbi:uncharacterized protein H6S33_010795 [Morchella sextelata]|uniref:uncharacterized protein n=1 Tax=Morchella sextelata TaxID=1174677 RepID=UPI001D0557FE|nr:uncharacterized protein H6S33_010795 [Morchella sextelata]KAH0611530.1 hypothetical protein H6S33_010795 [Morchella sextelata]
MVASAYTAGVYNERGFLQSTRHDREVELERVGGVLAAVPGARHIIIYTDTEYFLGFVKNWRPLWERHGFVGGEGNVIADHEVIKSILNIIDRRTLNNKQTTFEYIKSISKDLYYLPPIRPNEGSSVA